MKRLNYIGWESKNNNNLRFMHLTHPYIYIYITFKQSQGHQTWYDSVDLEHGYNRAKFCDLFPGSQGVQVDKRVILGGGKGIGRGREGGGDPPHCARRGEGEEACTT